MAADGVFALDIGNGSIKWGLFRAGRRVSGGRFPLDVEPHEIAQAAGNHRLAAVSVNPPVLARIRAGVGALTVIGQDVAYPIPVRYRPPEDCGADRVMAAVGALRRCSDSPGVLVFEAGTCLTATVATRAEGVLGGAILPGPDLMLEALSAGTARLPRVSPDAVETAIGDSTEDSIRSGVDAAVVGAVRELADRIPGETGISLAVVAAGTGAGSLAARIPKIGFVHPFATLWGVYETIDVL